MVIGFKPRFVEPYKKGIKIHTIREDSTDRWYTGMTMHMATGVRTRNYRQFGKETMTGKQRILIDPFTKSVSIDGKNFTGDEVNAIAINDGFANVKSFWLWWDKPFIGFVLHWTDFKY